MADEPVATTSATTTEATVDLTDWRTSIPEDLRADPSLKDFKDVGGLAKSYVDTKRMVGANGNRRPADDAPAEEWTTYFGKRQGRPETIDKYAFKVPALPEGMPGINEDRVSSFRELSHSLGLGNRETQAFVDWEAKQSIAEHDRMVAIDAAQKREAMATLRQKWGPAYERNVTLARQAVKDLFEDAPHLAARVEDAGNDPVLLEGFARIGERMLEHGEITGRIPGGETLDDVRAKMEAMRADPNPQNWPKDKQEQWHALVQREYRLRPRQ